MLAVVLAASPCAVLDGGASAQAETCHRLNVEAPEITRPSLDDIYARPGFERARQRGSGALNAWITQVLQWLKGLFEARGAESFSNLTRVVVLGVALVTALVVAVRVRRRGQAAAQRGRDVDPGAGPLHDPAAHLSKARALVDAAPREALREGWLATLASLERERWARPERTRTNREVAQDVVTRGAPAAIAATVTELVERFDLAWYSLAPPEPSAVREFLVLVEQVVGP